MYIRVEHAELDVALLHEFIRQFPLGLFTTAIPHPDYATLQTTHIPFVIDEPEASTDAAGLQSSPNLGRLRGHMARANPQSKAMIASVSQPTKSAKPSGSGFLTSMFSSSSPRKSDNSGAPDELSEDVLILFQAPTHSYVTPSFYTATKPSSGKVVPTWDYAAVQVYGRARVYHVNNATTGKFLQLQVEALSNEREPKVGANWKVGDAPESYIEMKKRGIIGVEVEITKIEGRFKLSQEEKDGDWAGIVKGFRKLGTEEGSRMAEMVEARGMGRDRNLIDDSEDQKENGDGQQITAVKTGSKCNRNKDERKEELENAEVPGFLL